MNGLRITPGLPVEGLPSRRNPLRRLVDGLFAPWLREPGDLPYNWQQDAHRAYLEQRPLRARSLLYGIALVVVALVIWSALAEIDEVTRGQGKVIPSRQVQLIQSQDGGVVTEILVREGDVVAEGQLLLRLDQTRSRSNYRENRAEYQALSVKAARLRAVVDKTEFLPSEELATAVPRLVAQERALFESSQAQLVLEMEIAEAQLNQRREELGEATARERQAARSLELTRRELQVTRPMIASGAVSEVELLGGGAQGGGGRTGVHQPGARGIGRYAQPHERPARGRHRPVGPGETDRAAFSGQWHRQAALLQYGWWGGPAGQGHY
jgi:adhesin transport system membrane fusion protein